MYHYKDKFLTPEEEKALFGYNALEAPPPAMAPWTLGWESEMPTQFGEYVAVSIEPAWIEMHHQAEVIDENGDPLPGIWVIFSMPGNTNSPINLMPQVKLWNRYSVLTGNAQRTNRMGYAQHTFGSGGEDIFVWDIQNNRLELPCPTVTSCNWVGTNEGAPFIHTGVKITFQRRRLDVEPRGRQLDRIETKIQFLEGKVAELANGQPETASIEALAADLKTLKETQSLVFDNLKLKLELLEAKMAGLAA